MHHEETAKHPPDVLKSPLVQRYLSEDGPSSPYRESVTFIRHQLQLSEQEAERQRDYWRHMNIRHEHQVRPVTDEEYQRLLTKTLLHPTRTLLEPDTEIHIARWPQSERHIRGVDAWHASSGRPHTHQHPEQLQQLFTDSELSRLLEGESRELKEHIESVYEDFAGSDAGSGPHLPICTPSALRAMQGEEEEEEEAERGGDEFDRLTTNKQSHTHTDIHRDMHNRGTPTHRDVRRGSHKDSHDKIDPHTNTHAATPVHTLGSARACKSPLCEVSQTEIDVFSLSDAEIAAIASLREKLLLVVDTDSPATHAHAHEEHAQQRFSPPSGMNSAQAPTDNAHNNSNTEAGERYTVHSAIAQHTHAKQRPKSAHRKHTQTPEKREFSATATTPLRLPTTLFPQSPLPTTRTSDLFPDRRMSPMEMKRFRVAHEQSVIGSAEDVAESQVLDPDVYFTMRALRDKRSTHNGVPPLALGSPHPEIKGQFVIPPDGESARERERERERERQKLNELISQANATANTKENADANTSEENANGNDENEEMAENESDSTENKAIQLTHSHSHSQSASESIEPQTTPSQRTNDTESPRQPAVRPALPFSPALLGDLKAGRSLRATPAKKNDSDKEGADTKSAKEKEERERVEQAERYQRFRHSMLVHHVCEFSRERFSTVKLLGRGKFAAVYSAQKHAPLSASRSLKEKKASSDSADDRVDETMAFLRTIFRCHESSSVSDSNEDENSSDANGLHGALKVAQFKGNGQSETMLPPISVLEEFEREILALRALPHPRIVRLLGYCASPFSIVMELVKGENLHNALKNIPLQCAAGAAERVSVAKDIVSALEFMHQKHYIHRDVKSHNVLITKDSGGNWSAKIADLGAAVKLSFAPSAMSVDDAQLLHEPMGTSGYTAPEILRPDHVRYAYPSDVFSVAIVLWELFTKVQCEEDLALLNNPLSGLNPNEAYEKIMNGLRPSLEGEYLKSLLRLRETISFAWASEAQDRLTMSQLLHSLESM